MPRKIPIRNNGFSLIEVMIAIGVFSIIGVGVSKYMSQSMNASGNIRLSNERERIRSFVLSQIDCEATFQQAGIDPANPGSSCNSTSRSGGQVGPFLRLARSTVDGNVHWLTPDLESGNAKLGGWTIRASCSESEQSLIVRMARLNENGEPIRDPLTKKRVGLDDDKALIFGVGDSALPLCFQSKTSGGGSLISAETSYKAQSDTRLRLDAPEGTGRVVISYQANHVAGHGWGSEDTTTMKIFIDLVARNTSGTYTHTGGNGSAATAAFHWSDIPFGVSATRKTGDASMRGYGTENIMPSLNVTYSSTTRQIEINNINNRNNEQGVFFIEYYAQ